MSDLFCFGYGYTARFLTQNLSPGDWTVHGTTRHIGERTDNYTRLYKYNSQMPLDEAAQAALSSTDAVLISIPPTSRGDMVYHDYFPLIRDNPNLKWLGLLSTTGVYGDHDGEWVDETTPPNPIDERGQNRLKAEEQWLNAWEHNNTPTHIFRLSGIYGPARNPMQRILNGNGHIIHKPGHYFNRIHVEDIAGILAASMQNPTPGEIYNLCDHEPAKQMEVMHYAYRLLRQDPSPPVDYNKADLSDMARSFYQSNKRVKNNKIIKALGYNFKYPTFREGLASLLPDINEGKNGHNYQ